MVCCRYFLGFQKWFGVDILDFQIKIRFGILGFCKFSKIGLFFFKSSGHPDFFAKHKGKGPKNIGF